jgi:hypothetical protein
MGGRTVLAVSTSVVGSVETLAGETPKAAPSSGLKALVVETPNVAIRVNITAPKRTSFFNRFRIRFTFFRF